MNKPHTPETKAKISAAKKGRSNATLLRPTQQHGTETHYQCGRCAHYLPKTEFYPSRTTLIGITATCKPCNKENSSARRKKAKIHKYVQE